MSRFIEEFYYGNIDPQARSTKENKAVQKQMEILMKNEDLLTNALTDKPKKWFLEYVNAWGVVNGESKICIKSNSIPKKSLIFNVRRKKWHEQLNIRCIFCNLRFFAIN